MHGVHDLQTAATPPGSIYIAFTFPGSLRDPGLMAAILSGWSHGGAAPR